jgi:antitoxin YefM
MPTAFTYTQARANLAALCDKVSSSHEPIIIRRRGAEDVALVDAAELRGLTETAHLLRSPQNARRLIAALIRARGRASFRDNRGSAAGVRPWPRAVSRPVRR